VMTDAPKAALPVEPVKVALPTDLPAVTSDVKALTKSDAK